MLQRPKERGDYETGAPRHRYQTPSLVESAPLQSLLSFSGRDISSVRQLDLLRPSTSTEATVFYAGNIDLLQRRAVSIVGTRDVSEDGARRAGRLARELVEAGLVVMSGLAKGVDYFAHSSAVESNGSTVAVIGTPLDKAYPAENARLQELIYREHLLISPFAIGSFVGKSNFPKRNRVMALLSDATVIVEASDTSGTLHQAAECLRQGRWLFIMRNVAEDSSLSWPAKFIGKPKVGVLTHTRELIAAVSG